MKMNFQSFTNWKIGDFILQLLVVILGIVITFAASNAVSKHAKAKEVAKAMEIVRDELKQNLEVLDEIREQLRTEQRICGYILRHKDQLKDVSADTLRKYISLPFQAFNFIYGTDAMEMLKASSLIPNVRNKKMMLEIMKAYNGLKEAKETVTWYYELKGKHCDQINKGKKFIRPYEELIHREYNRDVYKIFLYQISDINIYNIYILAAKGIAFEDSFQNIRNHLILAIKMIDREYSQ